MPSIAKPKPLPENVIFGDHSLPLVCSGRRKTIAIKLRKGELVLEVPKAMTEKQLQTVLKQNHDWFLKRIGSLIENLQPNFTGLDGEAFHLFGVEYQVKWQEGENLSSDSFGLEEDSKVALFHFCAKTPVSQRQIFCFQAIESHMKEQAYSYLLPKLNYYALQIGISYQSLTVKGYKSRWGSCYSDGRIQFNWRLMQAPEWVIDYVVVHELAHLIHANHSKAFWDVVECHYPKTKQAKQFMKQHGRTWIGFLQN